MLKKHLHLSGTMYRMDHAVEDAKSAASKILKNSTLVITVGFVEVDDLLASLSNIDPVIIFINTSTLSNDIDQYEPVYHSFRC